MGATASVQNIIRDEGFLYWNPSKVSDLGENLGYLKEGFAFFPNMVVAAIYSETSGLVPEDYIYSGHQYTATVHFLEIKTTSLQRGFLQTVASGPSLTLPGSLLPGTSLLSGATSGKILFVPKDSTNHPSIYATAVCGVLKDSIHYDRGKIVSLSVIFYLSDMKFALLSTLLPA